MSEVSFQPLVADEFAKLESVFTHRGTTLAKPEKLVLYR